MIAPERLAAVEALSLRSGAHPLATEMCVMEAVAYVAGEPWSDHPQCACPVIGAFLRNWNDALPSDAERDRLLKPLVPRLVGSRSTGEVELRRAWMALDWLARVHAPAWLELAGLTEHAELCRSMAEFKDDASCKANRQIQVAAGAAAWAAARAAARAAAWAAAMAAAVDAAWAAARAAARSKLAPTVATLQLSALELIDRMLLVGEP